MAQLPNLSQLRVSEDTGATLFEYLVEKRANKGDCTRHVDLNKKLEPPGQRPSAPGPSTPADMVETMRENVRRWEAKRNKHHADLAGQHTQSVNCAIDGYVMYKPVSGAVDVSTLAPDYLEKPLHLTLPDGTPLKLPTLNDPIKRVPGDENDARRKREFEKANPTWASDVFTDACKPSPKGKSIISWRDYGAELSGATDWYYLYDESGVNSKGQPERKTGHLFIQLFDSEEMKVGKHMPTAGAFSGRYLYIGLVCGLGLGKKFMEIAYAASKALGCDGIALATMVNSAGFYYSSQGFQFMDKVDGSVIDVSQYTEQRMVNDRPRAILLENYDPDDARGQVRARDDADADAIERAGRRAPSQRRRQTMARLSYFA